MKRLATALFSLALVALLFSSPATTHAAAEGALCWADDYELTIGDFTGIYCTGFSPLTTVNVYYVEPGGTAVAYADVKADANGSVAFGWGNGFQPFYSNQLGAYTIVVQQLGLNETVEIFGKIEITNSGAGDHVSGAQLSIDKTVVDRSQDSLTLTGWGFAPNEVITIWGQRPTLCDSYTAHYVDGKNGVDFSNNPRYDDVSTYLLFDVKADATGAFSFTDGFGAGACEGTWRLVARGNTSGWGAYVDVIVTGPSVSTNAWLVPASDSVGAMFDTLQFYAYGFAPNEILNCWTTGADGRAQDFGIPGSFDTIKVGADGSGVISFSTGSRWIHEGDFDYQFPLMSEGALGVWHLTCRGGLSGATAIADFTIHGYETAP